MNATNEAIKRYALLHNASPKLISKGGKIGEC